MSENKSSADKKNDKLSDKELAVIIVVVGAIVVGVILLLNSQFVENREYITKIMLDIEKQAEVQKTIKEIPCSEQKDLFINNGTHSDYRNRIYIQYCVLDEDEIKQMYDDCEIENRPDYSYMVCK